MIDMTVPHLPDGMPRYVMGVGKPIDLVESVARGIDMFDCVLPTRSGRHGQALLSWHNTAFFQALMQEIRAAVAEGPLRGVESPRISDAWATTKSKTPSRRGRRAG
jgi:queuine tRNA-ribosyltransferase